MSNNIYTVVVTYNRLELLKESIFAIQSQTVSSNKIVIVDNASTDGTDSYIDNLSVEYDNIIPLHLDINSGGAGGFYYGIKYAYENGADWVWVMDDDTIPTSNALEALLNSPMAKPNKDFSRVGFLASEVNWINGERCRMNIPSPVWEWNWFHDRFPGCYRLQAASFVSILISRSAIKEVGYPIKEFFIWFDDWEYTKRISTNGHLPCFYVKDSIVVHKTPVNLGLDYSYINTKNIWKYKYGIRNEVSLTNISKVGFIRACFLILQKIRFMKRNGVSFRLRCKILRAGLSGLFFKYKKYIENVEGK